MKGVETAIKLVGGGCVCWGLLIALDVFEPLSAQSTSVLLLCLIGFWLLAVQ